MDTTNLRHRGHGQGQRATIAVIDELKLELALALAETAAAARHHSHEAFVVESVLLMRAWGGVGQITWARSHGPGQMGQISWIERGCGCALSIQGPRTSEPGRPVREVGIG